MWVEFFVLEARKAVSEWWSVVSRSVGEGVLCGKKNDDDTTDSDGGKLVGVRFSLKNRG